jgi:predicted peptidase
MHFPKLLRRSCLLLTLSFLVGVITFAAELSKDDIEFRKKTYVSKKGERLQYRLFVPVTYSKERRYPLVLWLHGGEGRGSDNVHQITKSNEKGSHFWTSEENQQTFPAFVLAPQCPIDDNWADPELNEPSKALLLTIDALDSVEKEFSIDLDRVYIVGQSMGGLGVWALLQKYPEKWAAAIVISAYDNFTNPAIITHIPVWVFQGDADQTVPVDLVRQMMAQLKKLHANLRYTEYHKADHDVWNRAFVEPGLLPWLSAQTRGQPAPAPPNQLGSSTSPANH